MSESVMFGNKMVGLSRHFNRTGCVCYIIFDEAGNRIEGKYFDKDGRQIIGSLGSSSSHDYATVFSNIFAKNKQVEIRRSNTQVLDSFKISKKRSTDH